MSSEAHVVTGVLKMITDSIGAFHECHICEHYLGEGRTVILPFALESVMKTIYTAQPINETQPRYGNFALSHNCKMVHRYIETDSE